MEVCEEMQLLRNYLDVKKIPWHDDSEEFETSKKDFEMWICRTKFIYKAHKVSVINGMGTYGGWGGANLSEVNLGLLEIMIDDNEPFGWLNAEECMELLETEDERYIDEIALLGYIREFHDLDVLTLVLQDIIQKTGPIKNEKIAEKIKKHIASLKGEKNGKENE